MPVAEIATRFRHAVQGIADGFGQFGFARDLAQLRLQPKLQLVEYRLGLGLPQSHALFWGFAACLLLDRVKLRDRDYPEFCALAW